MMLRREGEERKKRWSVYMIAIVIGLTIAAGRIAVVTSKEGDTAFLSANDRSRWCTVAALVEDHTYAIDRQIAIKNEQRKSPWDSIDKVRHYSAEDDQQHYYSSKPPLYPTLVAGVYKLVHLATGLTLTEYPIYATRIILLLVNLPLLAVFYLATIESIDRIIHSEWSRTFAAFACCFGTMLLPFSITLNNHLPAAAATALTMWIYVVAMERLDDRDDWKTQTVPFGMYLSAGLAAAFAAANELPALSMMVFWLLLFAKIDKMSIFPFVIGVVMVAGAFFGTNWFAHQSLRPPYAHRGNGSVIATLATASSNVDETMKAEISDVLRDNLGIDDSTEASIKPSDEENRWVVDAGPQRFALLSEDNRWKLARWDDWYEYEKSYWTGENRKGVDKGEPSRLKYLFHMMIGHHGLFSLTPLWLLVTLAAYRVKKIRPRVLRRLAYATLVATSVCILFYLMRPEIDRNYGGVSVCFRWLLWFAPLWLLISAPMIERMSDSIQGRIFLMLMLAGSVFSASLAFASPWQPPWLYQYWEFLGWIAQ